MKRFIEFFTKPDFDVKFIEVPDKVKANSAGFIWFSKLLNEFEQIEFKTELIIDFSKTSTFEGNLFAVLGSILDYVKNKGNIVTITNVNNSGLNKIMNVNGFLKYFGGQNYPDDEFTSVEYRKFSLNKSIDFLNYVKEQITEREGMPSLSRGLIQSLNKSIHELYQNAIIHSHSDVMYACGQRFYGKKPKLALTLVDIGDTISKNVQSFKEEYKNYTSAQCISWAVEPGNSTKQNEPGGLGFQVFREFVSLNQGAIHIKSGNGYWEQKKDGTVDFIDQELAFNGTIVNMEINLKDNKSYWLTTEEIETNNTFNEW